MLAILVGGLALRVLWFATHPHPYDDSGMSSVAAAMAQQVEHGRGFVVDAYELATLDARQDAQRRLVDPPPPGPSTTESPLTLPGLPAVMAVVWKLTGDHYEPLQVLMVLLDTVNILLVFVVSRRLLGDRVALAAAAIYAAVPIVIQYSDMVTDAIPTATAALLVLLVASGAVKLQGSWLRTALLLGVVGGVSAYVRSNALVFAVAACIGLLPFLGWRIGSKAVLTTAVVGYAIFLPWVIRDAVDLHAFLPVGRTGTGQTLYEGLDLPGGGSDEGAYHQAVAAGVTAPYGSVPYDNYLGARFTDTLRSHPTTVLAAWLRHAYELATLHKGEANPALRQVALWSGELALTFALAGMALRRVQWRQWFPVAAVAVGAWATQIPFLYSPRFSVALVPPLVILAAMVVDGPFTRRRPTTSATEPHSQPAASASPSTRASVAGGLE